MILARYVWSTAWNTAAEALIGLVIVGALIVVSRDEHSTAGIALSYVPVVGAAIAGATAWLAHNRTGKNSGVATSR